MNQQVEKLNINQATKLINSGKTVMAITSRTKIPVKTLNDLNNLSRLAEEKVQPFELFYEKPANIPEGAIEVDLDDAIRLLYDKETVCTIKDDKELNFSSSNELIQYYRSCNIHGKACILYWYV